MTEQEYLELLKKFTDHYYAMREIALKIKKAKWSYPLGANSLYDVKVEPIQLSGDIGNDRFVRDSVISEDEHTIERNIIVNRVKFYEVIEFKEKKEEQDND